MNFLPLIAIFISAFIIYLLNRDIRGFGNWYQKIPGSVGNFFREGINTESKIVNGNVISIGLLLFSTGLISIFTRKFRYEQLLVENYDVIFISTIVIFVGLEIIITAGFTIYGRIKNIK